MKAPVWDEIVALNSMLPDAYRMAVTFVSVDFFAPLNGHGRERGGAN